MRRIAAAATLAAFFLPTGVAHAATERLWVDTNKKVKSKNFVDTVVYRGGDAVSGWVYAAMAALGLGMTGIAWAAVPIALVWLTVGLFLGRRYRTLESGAEPAVQPTS